LTGAKRLADERLAETAAVYGKSPAQVLIRWNIQFGVAPLPKANRREHLVENVRIFEFEIGDARMGELEEHYEHYSSLASLP
jgi:2,5-diketo-D-gluconate reductase A